MTETNVLKKSMSLRDISNKYHVKWTAVYQAAVQNKVPFHRVGKKMHMYEEDYIDYMGHKYDRTRSKHNGKPLFEDGEISVQQCAKMFGLDTVRIYYLVQRGRLFSIRKGGSIVLNYEKCMEFFTKNEGKQMELIND